MKTKRWGSEEILFSGAYLFKRLVLKARHCTSMHFHYAKCETLYILEGQLTIEFEDWPTVTLNPGQWYTIREGKCNAHRMTAGDVDCVYLEASTPHECDSERIRL